MYTVHIMYIYNNIYVRRTLFTRHRRPRIRSNIYRYGREGGRGQKSFYSDFPDASAHPALSYFPPAQKSSRPFAVPRMNRVRIVSFSYLCRRIYFRLKFKPIRSAPSSDRLGVKLSIRVHSHIRRTRNDRGSFFRFFRIFFARPERRAVGPVVGPDERDSRRRTTGVVGSRQTNL